MKKKDLISIIIPYYKVEKQIERCLDSVINQTYDNLEIICVGGKGEDPTKKIVNDYSKKYKNMIVLEQDGKGTGNARNKGLEIAKGKYILFLDSDDYIEHNTVELMYKKIIKEKSDIVCCGFNRIDDITSKVYSHEMMSMKYDKLDIDKDNVEQLAFISPCPWGKLFKREVIINERFSDKPIAAEDLVYFLNIIPKIQQISFLKKELWHYVVRSDSLIFQTTVDKAKELEKNLSEIREKYINQKLDVSYLKMIDLTAFIHLGISMASRIKNENKSLNKYLKYIKKKLNDTFVYWDKTKIRINNKITIKSIILNIVRISYNLNIFIIFLYLYNFMIKYLKIDIKW